MSSLKTVTIRITFVSADEQQRDPATIGTIARHSIEELGQHGYTIQPAYSGTKGGEIFEIATQLGKNVVDNKELLIALIGVATPILTFLLDRQKKRLEMNEEQLAALNREQQQSIQIYLTINETTTPIAPFDLEDNERLLRKLLEQQPNLAHTVTSETIPEIEVHVQSKPPRLRR